MPLLLLGGVLLVAALVLMALGRVQAKTAGIPLGRVIYCDTDRFREVSEALVDRELRLSGKPDYLVESRGRIIPVEVKTGRTPRQPYEAHIFQLAAYCRLVEAAMGRRPPYGILHYPEQDFAIDYTPELESALLDLVRGLHRDETPEPPARSHQEAARCQGCGYRKNCPERLG